MEQKRAYENLADWFEYLNDDCGYEEWLSYLLGKLRAFPLKNGLDVGCGTGWFTRAFYRAGYQMTGMDISAQMLDKAQKKSLKEGIRAEYLLGDLTKFRALQKFDFVTAINDCLNYIPKNKLDLALKNIKNALNKNGVFLFDISSEGKIRGKVANTVSVDDRDEVTYLSFNKPEEDGVTMEVSLFVKEGDGRYRRLEETHRQYLYTEEEILSALERNGFTLLEVEGHLGEDKSVSDRITFLAKRS